MTVALRTSLVLVGIGIASYGAVLVLARFGLDQIIGLAIWLAAAVVLHDFILVPIVTLIARFAFGQKTSSLAGSGSAESGSDFRPNPGSRRLAIVRALLVSASLISVVVVPEIVALGRGVANPTILPGDYAHNLLWLWAFVLAAVVAVLGIGLIAARLRR
ncbi:hypothetical protein [Brevibacterium aurantiacum]|uniref:Uncharacterized protein n=1 Tax=Brevibacterium aurantiacum TaxID=273384 RepID=A0A556CQ25_BREAU|nr:hypothetical protein [Brevibacterium aurantiacum]TSI19541.1 hypothetical protein FO013_00820 [Brevibacterium aurantiacum]